MNRYYAGFWRRTGAFVCDLLFFLVLTVVLGGILGRVPTRPNPSSANLLIIPSMLAAWAVIFLVPPLVWHGQTFGKRMLGILVVNDDGSPAAWWKAFLRVPAYLASYGPVLAGFFWCIWDKDRRCFHDMLLHTRVILLKDQEAAVQGLQQMPAAVRRRSGRPGLFDPRTRRGRIFRGIGIVAGALALVAGAMSAYEWYQNRLALAAYGQDILDMCQDPDSTPEASSVDPGSLTQRVVVVSYSSLPVDWTRNSISNDRVQNAIPRDRRALDRSEVTGVVCLRTRFDHYSITTPTEMIVVGPFGGGSTDSGIMCTSFQQIQQVFLIDPATGRTVKYGEFAGPPPSECSGTESLYGQAPDPAAINAWIFDPANQ